MGHNIVLVSNQAEALESTREELVKTYPRQRFLSVFLDLTAPNAADILYEYCESEGLEISILVNNAGIFSFRTVLDTSPHALNLYVDLHMRTVTQLCHRFGHAMSRRHCGYILNMSSMSCWMPMPGIALYAATKAYIRVFSRALALELSDEGVSVMVSALKVLMIAQTECPISSRWSDPHSWMAVFLSIRGLPKILTRPRTRIGRH